MKMDFHTHANLTKNVDFKVEEFIDKINEARESGLDAIALTEHFNTKNFKDIYKQLHAHFPYKGDYYDVDGFKVFTGIEIDIKEVGHILLVGNRRDILKVYDVLIPHLPDDNHISFKKLLDVVSKLELLKIGAHPFRSKTPLHHIDFNLLKQLDALDLNATDIYRQGITVRDEVEELAGNLDLPVIAGSDTHHHLQYGSVYNILFEEPSTVHEIKLMINAGSYEVKISPCLKEKVKAARLIKKVLKKQL
ncbi:PHP domain-containing protein [Gracilibacillus alcaliphilus]|uniref:PHP domain-containing protein n=1 Tax=Gracilibacillus alcaliphilus TaxID=1401441 RepID=UPI00195CC69D|nr:PHP domain-containing protein [Gracilibacillus alcaliphilus]MBM7677726.1 histidinol phosphatase-like PHP family hydrolase [Gracilibacillus alcaliphilus]